VSSVAFSPNGQRLAIGSLNATYSTYAFPVNHSGGLVLWNVTCASVAVADHITTVTDPGTKGVVQAAFSSDGKMLAVADGNDTTYVWNVSGQAPAPVASFPDPARVDLAGVVFGPANTVFTADGDGNVYEWQIPAPGSAAAGPVATFPGRCGDSLDALALSPGGRMLAAACYNGNVDVWNISAHTSFTLTDPDRMGAVTVAFGGHDGSTLASGALNGQTYLWDLASRQLLGSLQAADVDQAVKMVVFNPAGTILLTADAHGYIYAWSVATRTLLDTITPADGEPVLTVAFSSSGATFGAGDYGGEAGIWYAGSLNQDAHR